MTIDSTDAKIGRSMKKRENKTDSPERLSVFPRAGGGDRFGPERVSAE
jgi:hypothetical protein